MEGVRHFTVSINREAHHCLADGQLRAREAHRSARGHRQPGFLPCEQGGELYDGADGEYFPALCCPVSDLMSCRYPSTAGGIWTSDENGIGRAGQLNAIKCRKLDYNSGYIRNVHIDDENQVQDERDQGEQSKRSDVG